MALAAAGFVTGPLHIERYHRRWKSKRRESALGPVTEMLAVGGCHRRLTNPRLQSLRHGVCTCTPVLV